MVTQLEQRMPEVHTELENVKSDLQNVSSAEQEHDQEVRQTRVKVEEMRSSFESSKARGKVLEALLDLKKSGRMPGIYGRLVSPVRDP